jgi:hypothetical protein
VAWSGDLPRHLQQVVFDTADAGWPMFPQELQDFLALATDRRAGAQGEPCARHLPGGDG